MATNLPYAIGMRFVYRKITKTHYNLVCWNGIRLPFNRFPNHIIYRPDHVYAVFTLHTVLCMHKFPLVHMWLFFFSLFLVRLNHGLSRAVSISHSGQVNLMSQFNQHHYFKLTVIYGPYWANTHSFTSISFWLFMILTHFYSDVMLSQTKMEEGKKEQEHTH